MSGSADCGGNSAAPGAHVVLVTLWRTSRVGGLGLPLNWQGTIAGHSPGKAITVRQPTSL